MYLTCLITVAFLGTINIVDGFSLQVERVEKDLTDTTSKKVIMYDSYGHALNNWRNVIYKGVVTLGSPPQAFSVILDTGSDIFWVPAKGCTSRGPLATSCSTKQNLYDSRASSTSVNTGRSFNIRYGTGSAFVISGHMHTYQHLGTYYQDVFAFGGLNDRQLKLKSKVLFGAAQRMTFGDQGILGLAPPRTPEVSVFQRAVNDGLMDKPIFTAYMRNCRGSCQDGGTITFGSEDRKHCTRVYIWVPILPHSPWWLFNVDGFEMGGASYGAGKAFTDTGASDIIGPSRIISRFISAVGGRRQTYGGANIVPCSSTFQFVIKLGKERYRVPSSQLIDAPVGKGYCIVRLNSSPNIGEMWVLGGPWIRTFCQVHDVANKRVGFAMALKSN